MCQRIAKIGMNVSHNYLYSSSLNATTCNSSAQLLSLHNNCFNSSAMPCNLTHTQRPREKCSAFCHLSPPSTPPCPGHGYQMALKLWEAYQRLLGISSI
ncbi:hypothetical protein CLOM_g23098 [Closterium sp. NIES-68]|nr:hypothetical protein CLOM_g23098 [Closterium sp. NIES-68]